MNITVTKLTDLSLLQKANSYTTGKESKMSLAKAYAMGHSPIRAQIFTLEMTDIPLFVASQFVRSSVGVTWFMRSKRTDRGGEDFRVECYDFGQRLDIIAENINECLSEKQADDLTQTLDEMEDEVKEWPSRFDRYAPTNLMCIINAEALMNLAHKRLCSKASKEATEVFNAIKAEVAKVDPDLAKHLVPTCIYRGGICPEAKPCGYNKNEKALNEYKGLF